VKTLLVVEDGTEYVEAFRRLARGEEVELVRAADAEEARGVLARRRVDGIFLDVVFDRTPEERLCGDPARPAEQRARQQGFYLAAELADALPASCRVVIAYDFAAEPGRLAALRRTLPSLEGVEDGAPLSRVLERLLGPGS
jgi:CheY-like chemotaxis protein